MANQAFQARSELLERERIQSLALFRKVYSNLSHILDPNSARNRHSKGSAKQYETVHVTPSTASKTKHKKGTIWLG